LQADYDVHEYEQDQAKFAKLTNTIQQSSSECPTKLVLRMRGGGVHERRQ
jgi:hypothetical protein